MLAVSQSEGTVSLSASDDLSLLVMDSCSDLPFTIN